MLSAPVSPTLDSGKQPSVGCSFVHCVDCSFTTACLLTRRARFVTDVAKYLLENFGQRLRNMRSQPPPGKRRELKEPLDTRKGLSQHLSVLGRDGTLQHFVYWAAVIYKRWVGRGGESSNEFRRGLAHLLLLCFPGAGMAPSSPEVAL